MRNPAPSLPDSDGSRVSPVNITLDNADPRFDPVNITGPTISCRKRHLWTRLGAWVTGRQFFHACDVSWTSVTGILDGRPWLDDGVLLVDYDHGELPIPRHGGDITILPDHDFDHRRFFYSGSAVVPEVPLDGIERLRKRLGR